MNERQRDLFLWLWARRRARGAAVVGLRGALVGAAGGVLFSGILLSGMGAPAAAGYTGLSAVLLMGALGRIAGISGIFAPLLGRWTPDSGWRVLFIIGMLAGAVAMFGLDTADLARRRAALDETGKDRLAEPGRRTLSDVQDEAGTGAGTTTHQRFTIRPAPGS